MMAQPPVSTHGGIQRGLPEHRRGAPTCRWAEAAASLSSTTAPRSSRGACLLEQARSYLETFCFELEKPGKYQTSRLDEIESEIERTGGYQQTYEELAFGAKLAWRNHARCIGRLYWRSLEVLDCRQVTSMREAAARLEDHLRFAFNEGSIRSTISIFPARTNRDSPILIHNPQLLRYAGYPGPSGRTLGDPQNLAITAKANAMIAAFPADEASFRAHSAHIPIGQRHFKRCIDRFRTGIAEKHMVQRIRCHRCNTRG